jgi:TctA family transporter
MLEMSFRQSLAMSSGSYAIFINRPIAVTMLAGGMVLLLLSLLPILKSGMDWRGALGLSPNSETEKEDEK